jgi:AGZA family xanthine/uracil permease-like MFS transporter
MPDAKRPPAGSSAASRRSKSEGRATATPTVDSGTPADVVGTEVRPRRNDGPRARPRNGLDRYFEISYRRSTVGREIRGGLTTFFTMAYIVVLNPIILSSVDGGSGPGVDVSGGTLPFGSITAVTVVSCAKSRLAPFTSLALERMIGLSTTM